jgi:hypothetical protein
MSDETQGGPGVTVTLREIYDALIEVRGDVRSLVEGREDTDKTLEDHEQRLRSIERWKYGAPLATLIAVGSTVAAIWPRS